MCPQYLHESRHLHALNRVRGNKGRFVNHGNEDAEDNPSDQVVSSSPPTALASAPNSAYGSPVKRARKEAEAVPLAAQPGAQDFASAFADALLPELRTEPPVRNVTNYVTRMDSVDSEDSSFTTQHSCESYESYGEQVDDNSVLGRCASLNQLLTDESVDDLVAFMWEQSYKSMETS